MFPHLPPNIAGWHPLVVHFPIALLLVAPIFLILALVCRKQQRCLAAAALILMFLGTIGAAVAVWTGSEAGEYAGNQGLISSEAAQQKILPRHEDMAETTLTLFSILTVLQAAWLALPYIRKSELPRWLRLGFPIVFLVVYLACALVLAQTGDLGGRLVHEFGVQGTITPSPAAPK